MHKNFYKNKKSLLKLLLVLTLISYTLFFSFQKNILSGDTSYNNDELSNINFPNTSDQEITVITPENKTYTEPMSGYYTSTYGFEDENDDDMGEDIRFVDYDKSESSSYSKIIAELDGHKKVLETYDSTTNGRNQVTHHIDDGGQTYGSVEFWFRVSNVNLGNDIYFLATEGGYGIIFGVDNGYFRYNGLGNIVACSSNTWYHINLEFECSTGNYQGLSQYSWHVYIDGVLYGHYTFLENKPDVKSIMFYNGYWADSGGYFYYDAFDFSWNSDYTLGDNLNEGLLLSYSNTTNLEWQGYSLGGNANKTIFGNTTLPMPEDGQHRIQVFGNDSLGTMYESNIKHFTINSSHNIYIDTPENTTYTEPMSGYYPSIYGFEDENNDDMGEDIRFVDYDKSESSSYSKIIAELDGHKKVLETYDSTTNGRNQVTHHIDDGGQTYGSVEFWCRVSNVNLGYNIYFSATEGGHGIIFGVDNGYFRYNGLGNIVACSSNTWYHINLEFECSTGSYQGLSQYTWHVYINGVLYGHYTFLENKLDVKSLMFYNGYWADSGGYFYYDAFGFSWDSDYTIGDNLNEGLLLSYDNTTTLDWKGYSLDGNANKTIFGNTTLPMPEDGQHRIQMFGNDSLGTMYESDMRHFTVKHITIFTPENITYTEPMDGYYPATYGFENDLDGTIPQEWFLGIATGGTAQVVSELGGRKKVVQVVDTVTNGYPYLLQTFTSQTTGIVEFYVRKESGSTQAGFELRSAGVIATGIRIDYNNNGKFEAYQGAGYLEIAAGDYSDQTWFHIKVAFDTSTDTADFYVNGVLEASSVAFKQNVASIDRIYFGPNYAYTGSFYFDAVGYSWDSDYNIGDNLDEGLLLSFEKATNLDWIGYSLDGTINKTIIGNTTIPLPEDGNHNIQVFGNDSLGTIYSSDLQYFSVDNLSPIITINSPFQNEHYDSLAPNFDISITEPNLNATWYTIDSGLTNVTFTGFTGTIDQTEWDDQVEGSIIIRFYANDTFGRINYAEVLVEKDTTLPLIIINSPNVNDHYGSAAPNFDISITEPNLNATWYTIDSGLTNITFTGFTGTIDQTEWDDQVEGPIIIRFYANDSFGHINFAEVLVEKDTTLPSIIINSPNANDYYGSAAPNFDISITEPNLNATWYTIDSGLTNVTFTGFTGTIDQTEWDDQVDGQVTIRFYANDTFGHINFAEVLVEKDTMLPSIIINSPNADDYYGSAAPIFDISITEPNLNTTWYTIDSGLTNITFTGLTGTIDQTEWDDQLDGQVTIRFYANDTLGQIYYTDVLINKDTLDPVITINSPLTGEIFTALPPHFNLTIDEVNMDTTWYTLDGGATTIDFTELTGYIDSIAWNNAPIGAVTIRFYARDKAGNEVYQEVIVIKSSGQQEPPEIPGFNIVLLCLTIVIITTSLLKIKKYKVK